MGLYAIIWDYIVKPTRLRFSMDWFQGKSWPETAVIFGMMWLLNQQHHFSDQGHHAIFLGNHRFCHSSTFPYAPCMDWTKTPRFPTNMTYKYVGKYSLHGAHWGWVVTRCRAVLSISPSTSGGDHSLFCLQLSGWCQHSAIMSVGMLLCGNHTK